MNAEYAFRELHPQHTEELEYCRNIREAVRQQTDLDRLRDYTLDFWNFRLRQDFKNEDLKLFPLLQSGHSQSRFFTILKLDQDLIATVIERIRQNGSSFNDYTSIADLVEQHVEFEEKVVLPSLETVPGSHAFGNSSTLIGN